MNREKVLIVIRAMEHLAGRFKQMAESAEIVNNQETVMMNADAAEVIGKKLDSWAIVISEELIEDSQKEIDDTIPPLPDPPEPSIEIKE